MGCSCSTHKRKINRNVTVVYPKDVVGDTDMDSLLLELCCGMELEKVKSKRRRLCRTFYLDLPKMILFYEPSNKKIQDSEISFSKLKEVREGERDYSTKFTEDEKPQCFVLIYKSNKAMYLKAPDKESRDKWVQALRFKMAEMSDQNFIALTNNTNIRQAFNRADVNGDGHLDFEEIVKLLHMLNADIKRKYAREMFDAADKDKTLDEHKASVLNREEFVEFYHRLTRRVEIEEVYFGYSMGKSEMTIQDFLKFLTDAQKMEKVTEKQCQKIIAEFEEAAEFKKEKYIRLEAFRKFLTSEPQELFNPAHRVVYQDMTRPMTDYFINSSHNTYLEGDQLKGNSSTEMYITVLKKGCRCIELDCWDGPLNEPIIYHGYTLTTKISFSSVVKAINDYAFSTTPYPLILSLENHCCLKQQKVMADIMTSIFGDKLWCPQSDWIKIPSPEELRNKILIKGKRLPIEVNDPGEVSDEDEAAELDKNVAGVTLKNKPSGKMQLHPAISRLTALNCVNFETAERSTDKNFVALNLSEVMLDNIIKSNPQVLNKISHNCLIRAYPAAYRTDSSNFNIVPFMIHGVHILALNYQTGSNPMYDNHGLFMDNGGAGYVLRPDYLLSEAKFLTVLQSSEIKKVLVITIISGFQIPKPDDSLKGEIIDPFIRVRIEGATLDLAEYKTKTISNNGFNPRWYETCVFGLRVPEIALLKFTVFDEDVEKDEFVGYFCLPYTSIREGFRHFPLFDRNGVKFSQTLMFVHLSISNPQS
ncbi:1-phosphatidylinositol 4,5-bisphosphate phosphodiesterase eta-1-like [Physella acuta]|uniref:1-phosphatidylinositol 4,5-bisphosphate phosphodiesterase eta-1-like n=1 Tax=Physella acuta TaxID=109671 RepID=UPI0027DC79FA|nr:1-phosphatidylinositol 4,5-bisphosphate phosphodiesterase eta-1-like [Physella acuta]